MGTFESLSREIAVHVVHASNARSTAAPGSSAKLKSMSIRLNPRGHGRNHLSTRCANEGLEPGWSGGQLLGICRGKRRRICKRSSFFREQPSISFHSTDWSPALPSIINYEFYSRNDGEITIRSPLIKFQEIYKKHDAVILLKIFPPRITFNDTIIYPVDEIIIAGAQLSFECGRYFVIQEGDYKVRWPIFVDN